MVDRQFVAMKAFVEHDGAVLVLRGVSEDETDLGDRTGRYDVPGGRVEPGEAPLDALEREVREETDLPVDVGRPVAIADIRPTVGDDCWQVVATFVACRAPHRDVSLGDEHDEARWIDPAAYRSAGVFENLHGAFERYVAAKPGVEWDESLRTGGDDGAGR